jgi:hypothetical protein
MDFFTLYIYQPFFNILVGLYWVTSQFLAEPDMGIAVIFCCCCQAHIVTLDLLVKGLTKQVQISQKIKQIRKFADNPVRQRDETKK